MCSLYIITCYVIVNIIFAVLSLNRQDFTCGNPLSPEACSFSFIRATLAAVALFLAPLRPLLFDPSFDSRVRSQARQQNKLNSYKKFDTKEANNTDTVWAKEGCRVSVWLTNNLFNQLFCCCHSRLLNFQLLTFVIILMTMTVQEQRKISLRKKLNLQNCDHNVSLKVPCNCRKPQKLTPSRNVFHTVDKLLAIIPFLCTLQMNRENLWCHLLICILFLLVPAFEQKIEERDTVGSSTQN